jgi:predicted membrane protein
LKISAAKVALIAVFATLQALLSVFPFTITIGTSGQITLGVIGGPLIGILLGPFFGGAAVLVGSVVGVFLNPAGALFGFLTVVPPTVGA